MELSSPRRTASSSELLRKELFSSWCNGDRPNYLRVSMYVPIPPSDRIFIDRISFWGEYSLPFASTQDLPTRIPTRSSQVLSLALWTRGCPFGLAHLTVQGLHVQICDRAHGHVEEVEVNISLRNLSASGLSDKWTCYGTFFGLHDEEGSPPDILRKQGKHTDSCYFTHGLYGVD